MTDENIRCLAGTCECPGPVTASHTVCLGCRRRKAVTFHVLGKDYDLDLAVDVGWSLCQDCAFAAEDLAARYFEYLRNTSQVCCGPIGLWFVDPNVMIRRSDGTFMLAQISSVMASGDVTWAVCTWIGDGQSKKKRVLLRELIRLNMSALKPENARGPLAVVEWYSGAYRAVLDAVEP